MKISIWKRERECERVCDYKCTFGMLIKRCKKRDKKPELSLAYFINSLSRCSGASVLGLCVCYATQQTHPLYKNPWTADVNGGDDGSVNSPPWRTKCIHICNTHTEQKRNKRTAHKRWAQCQKWSLRLLQINKVIYFIATEKVFSECGGACAKKTPFSR